MVPVLQFSDVDVVRNGTKILNGFSWTVEADERWILLGPNGAGKTTVLNLAAAQLYPTRGTVTVLEEQLGHTNVFSLRPRIGIASSAAASHFPPTETVRDVVLTAAYAVNGRWKERYDEVDLEQANRELEEWQLLDFADRPYGQLSDGEKKRVQIARADMTDPELLLLDEPTSNLDLGAREELLQLLTGYATSAYAPAIVVVTHHVEEIPVGFTHALVLREGEVFASGPVESVVTSAVLSRAYGLKLDVTEQDGRFAARAVL